MLTTTPAVSSDNNDLFAYLRQGHILDEQLIRERYGHNGDSFILELQKVVQRMQHEPLPLRREQLNLNNILTTASLQGKAKKVYLLSCKLFCNRQSHPIINRLLINGPESLGPAVLNLLVECEDDLKTLVFKVLEEIPLVHRTPEVLRAIVTLLDGIVDFKEAVKIIDTLKSILQPDRVDVLLQTLPFLSSNVSALERRKILLAVKEIPSRNRRSLVESALSLQLEGITVVDYIPSLLRALQNLPSASRADVVAKVLPFLRHALHITTAHQQGTKRPPKLHIALILYVFHLMKIKEEEVADREFCFVILNFLDDLEEVNKQQCLDFLQLLLEMEDHRIVMVSTIGPLFKTIEEESQRDVALQVMRLMISAESTYEMLYMMITICKEMDYRPHQEEYFLKLIQELIAANSHNKTLHGFFLLLKGTQDRMERKDIYKVIQDLPVAERAKIIEKALAVTDPEANGYEKARILFAIHVLDPSHHTKEAIDEVASCFEGVFDSFRNCIFALVKTLAVQDRSPKNIGDIIMIFKCLGFSFHGMAAIFKVTKWVAFEERVALLQTLLRCISRVSEKQEREVLFGCLPWLPYTSWEDTITLLPALQKSTSPLTTLFSSHVDFKKLSYAHLQRCLTIPSPPEDKWSFIKQLIDTQYLLGLHDDHPIMQEAYIQGSLCHPDVLQEPQNPYRVFTELKAEHSSPPSLPPLLPHLPVGSRDPHFQWRLATLHEKATEWKGYTAKDLPGGVTAETLHDLCNTLLTRVSVELSQEEVTALQQTIKQQGGSPSLETLFNTLMTSEYIKMLLTVAGGQHSEALLPSETFMLFAIVRNLLDTSEERVAGGVLTEREDKLVRLASLVQECPTGQRGGILSCYNSLPSSYKLGNFSQITDRECVVVDKLDLAVQTSLRRTLESKKFINQLACLNEGELPQAVHQSTYLTNRCYPFIGLKGHQLLFDPHTKTVYTKLIFMPLVEILDVFFSHLTPIALHHVTGAGQELLHKKYYSELLHLLERSALWKMTSEVTFEAKIRGFIDFDELYEPIKVTERGAIALLQTLGYLLCV